ncbi:hypothetical protein Tco_1373606 [Tanacetum coccineum]
MSSTALRVSPQGFHDNRQAYQPISYNQPPPNFGYQVQSNAQLTYPVVTPVQPSSQMAQASGLYQVQPIYVTIQTVAHPGSIGFIVIPGQETTLPHAFSAVSLQDPTNGAWNMDTGFHDSSDASPMR